MSWTTCLLKDVLVKTENINPEKEPNRVFKYVDVSSVSKELFKITETQNILGSEAPSRARKLIKNDDVLFATIRPTLKRVALVPNDLDGEVCSTGYFVFRSNGKLLQKFIFYYLLRNEFMEIMEKIQTGASYPAVTDKQVLEQSISYPSLSIQQKIVEKLDSIFAEIDRASVATEANIKNAEALFQSYLTKIFDSGGEAWKKDNLTNICKVTTGKWDANHAVEDGTYRFYTCASQYLYCETKRYDGKNIILPGNGANVGELYFYDGPFDAYQRTYVLSDIKILPEYLFYHLKSNWEETNRFKQYGSATNFLKIGNFKDYIVCYPAIEEQKNIVTKLDVISREIRKSTKSYTHKVSELSTLKQSILKQAFNGELIKE